MEHVEILGCRVDAIGSDDAVRRIVQLARGEAPSLVVTLGTEMVVRARTEPRFRDVVNASALSLCDTIGVLFAARLHGLRMHGRVAGVDLIDPLCAALAAEGLPVFLLGGKGDTAARAAQKLVENHPNLLVAGACDGYFGSNDDAAVAEQVRRAGARVLFVGLGSPRQEYWIAEHLRDAGCSVGIGVGGSFDVIAGNVERAPAAWRRFNAEWLYRLVREPARWRRQLALPKFIWLAVRERVTARSTRRFS